MFSIVIYLNIISSVLVKSEVLISQYPSGIKFSSKRITNDSFMCLISAILGSDSCSSAVQNDIGINNKSEVEISNPLHLPSTLLFIQFNGIKKNTVEKEDEIRVEVDNDGEFYSFLKDTINDTLDHEKCVNEEIHIIRDLHHNTESTMDMSKYYLLMSNEKSQLFNERKKNDYCSDIRWIYISVLNSAQNEQDEITDSLVSQIINISKEKSSDKLLLIQLINMDPDIEAYNIVKRDVNDENDNGDINIAKNYQSDYPVMFNIILWFSVTMIFVLIAICIALYSMDPGRDSIIYRMTSTRMKKDN